MSLSKVDIKIVPQFFLISYSLVPKIEICLSYFLEKKLPKEAIVHKADQTRATASLQVQSVNAGAARLNFSLPLSSEHRLTFLVCMAT